MSGCSAGAAKLEVRGLVKMYGEALVLDHVSFQVEAGTITGVLGPNGAGKSTLFQVVMGLTPPTEGEVHADGRPLREWPSPAGKIAAVLSNQAAHPRRTAIDHLRWVAALLDVDIARCRRTLSEVGLADVADKPVGQFSLGMRQRLAIGTALLGDPEILLLDEPMNGLDPDGIEWLKSKLTALRAAGRTILLSSHLLKEMDGLVDNIVIIAQGRVVADGTLMQVLQRFEKTWVMVRVDAPGVLAEAVRQAGGSIVDSSGNRLRIAGVPGDTIGVLARDRGLVVQEMTEIRDLNTAYHEATRGQTDIVSLEG